MRKSEMPVPLRDSDKLYQKRADRQNKKRPLGDKLLGRNKVSFVDEAHDEALGLNKSFDAVGGEVFKLENAIVELGQKENFWVPAIDNGGLRQLLKNLLAHGSKVEPGNRKMTADEAKCAADTVVKKINVLGEKKGFWVPAIANGGLEKMIGELLSRGWNIEIGGADMSASEWKEGRPFFTGDAKGFEELPEKIRNRYVKLPDGSFIRNSTRRFEEKLKQLATHINWRRSVWDGIRGRNHVSPLDLAQEDAIESENNRKKDKQAAEQRKIAEAKFDARAAAIVEKNVASFGKDNPDFADFLANDQFKKFIGFGVDIERLSGRDERWLNMLPELPFRNTYGFQCAFMGASGVGAHVFGEADSGVVDGEVKQKIHDEDDRDGAGFYDFDEEGESVKGAFERLAVDSVTGRKALLKYEDCGYEKGPWVTLQLLRDLMENYNTTLSREKQEEYWRHFIPFIQDGLIERLLANPRVEVTVTDSYEILIKWGDGGKEVVSYPPFKKVLQKKGIIMYLVE